MQVLTEPEAEAFQAENRLVGKFEHLDPETRHTEFGVGLARRCVWANALTNHILTEESSVGCLDVTDWAVWPSYQNMDLFYSYRRYLGEHRSLMDAHFHVFKASEANEFRNILHLALLSLFDVAGASTTTHFRFYASHDEWIDILWYEGSPWQPTMKWLFPPRSDEDSAVQIPG